MNAANNHPSGLQNNNRRHWAHMYKNLQYLQSLWVHRQSAITGNTACSFAAAELHRTSILLLYWAYWSQIGILGQVYSCWFIVKLWLAKRHIMQLIVLCCLWFCNNHLHHPCATNHMLGLFVFAWLRKQQIQQTHIRRPAADSSTNQFSKKL